MAEVIDYIHDEEGDLVIKDGDFAKGDATQYHQKVLLLATKGSFTQSPTRGVSMVDFLLDDFKEDELRHVIQEEFEADGLSIQDIAINSVTGEINIEAEYGN